MGLLVLAILGVIFVLGLSGTADLVEALKDVHGRRSLLLRVAGFLAMSLWLHQLPTLLLLVYMRQEGVLASEVLSDDLSRTAVVGTYSMFIVAFLALLSCVGVFVSMAKEVPWKFVSMENLVGYGLATLFAVGIGVATASPLRALFFLTLTGTISLYLHITLLTPLKQQIRLYHLPFFVIGAITGLLFINSEITHELVRSELKRFRSGGGTPVLVTHDTQRITGDLVLLTNTAVYVRAEWRRDYRVANRLDDGCLFRIPVAQALVVHQPVLYDTPSRLDGVSEERAQLLERVKPTKAQDMDMLCGTALQPKKGAAIQPPAAASVASAPR